MKIQEDKLEQFIHDHRQGFDSEEPSPGLWNKIEKQLPAAKKERTSRFMYFIRFAAIFALGAITSAAIVYFINRHGSGRPDELSIQKMEIKKPPQQLKQDSATKKLPQNTVKAEKQLCIKQSYSHKHDQDQMEKHESLQEIQAYYMSRINDRLDKIMQLTSTLPGVKQQIYDELSQIDSICNNMQGDLKDNMNNQEVIDAMVMNYKTRVDILDETIAELQEKK